MCLNVVPCAKRVSFGSSDLGFGRHLHTSACMRDSPCPRANVCVDACGRPCGTVQRLVVQPLFHATVGGGTVVGARVGGGTVVGARVGGGTVVGARIGGGTVVGARL